MRENPPAFPRGAFQQGMTLRDWFAGMAIAGMASRDTYDPGQVASKQRAALAYIEADAMLAEREKAS